MVGSVLYVFRVGTNQNNLAWLIKNVEKDKYLYNIEKKWYMEMMTFENAFLSKTYFCIKVTLYRQSHIPLDLTFLSFWRFQSGVRVPYLA